MAAEPGKYEKDGVTREALDRDEANMLIWQGFKKVGGSKSSGSDTAKKAEK